ncbi:hypothetical protein CALCODRAFT_486305 [Calocera cornea HHB12733]|uniref:Uncharacterized protein n=1 Tax=Calocera cornea HHB12733 TaxID=1353952 RepID=A0A165DSY0_9BASI|nr:hypothetical protein CALCODRAFT_486305 [Calocera cornea HHB12733]
MKFFATSLALILVALPRAVKSQTFTFLAYDEIGECPRAECNGVTTGWGTTELGRTAGNFPELMYSFQLHVTSPGCQLIMHEEGVGIGQGYPLLTSESEVGACQWGYTGYRGFEASCN